MQKLTSSLNLARRKGIGAAFKAGLWRVKTAASKKRIALEDRYGWYSYADWIRHFEPPTVEPRAKAGDQDQGAAPRFSVVLNRSGGESSQSKRTLASLKAQSNPSWEALGTFDQKPADPDLQDERIRLETVPGPNSMLALLDTARGEFIINLEMGDTLYPDALAEVGRRLDHSPDLDIIYSDEDQLSEDGKRQTPFFKPDWSPELMLSINYLANAAIKRTLLQQVVEEHKVEVLGWDDLVWICAEKAHHIEHISRVFVHKSVQKGAGERVSSQLQQVAEYLRRQGLAQPVVDISPHGGAHVKWPVRGDKVSIVIPTKDRPEYIQRCVDTIRRLTDYPDYEIILVDSGSVEAETLRFYEDNPDLRVVPFEGPFNFSAALNAGAREAEGDVLLFLNNDTEAIESGWLTELVRWAERPEIGVVGAQLRFPDGSIQHAGIVIGLEGHASHVFGGARPGAGGPFGALDWYRNYTAITGACMAMRKSVFEEIGGFDAGYELVFSDIEICLRATRAGYRVMYTPFARLLHHEGKTRSRYIPARDIARGYADLEELVAAGDPYFSPNLSTAVRIPTFRRPGEEAPIDRLEEIVAQSA